MAAKIGGVYAEGLAKGLSKGLPKGLAKGVKQGKTEFLLRLAALRFGAISAAARKRIESAAPAQLDVWMEALLSVQSIDEMLEAGATR